MDKNLLTLKAYDESSEALSQKFNKMGARKEDISKVFSFFEHIENLQVLEIGCGNGRDAKEILNYTHNYIGIDYSRGMLKIAREFLPEAEFVLADFKDYQPEKNFDIVFSFASLLHLEINEMKAALLKTADLLDKDGILILSLKYSPEYVEEIVDDEVGTRFFYLYNPEVIAEISKNAFNIIDYEVKDINNRKWFEIILKKK